MERKTGKCACPLEKWRILRYNKALLLEQKGALAHAGLAGAGALYGRGPHRDPPHFNTIKNVEKMPQANFNKLLEGFK